MLDAHAQVRRYYKPQPLMGRFVRGHFAAGQALCRIGGAANTLRHTVTELSLHNMPCSDWHRAQVWARSMPVDSYLDPDTCASLARTALAAQAQDWAVECSLYSVEPLGGPLRFGS